MANDKALTASDIKWLANFLDEHKQYESDDETIAFYETLIGKLAICPACNNNDDGTILISAVCTALIEEEDQFSYTDCHVTPSSTALCTACGYRSTLETFNPKFRS